MKKIITIITLLFLVATIGAQTNKRHTTSKNKPKTAMQKSASKKTSKSKSEAPSKSTNKAKTKSLFCPDDKHPHVIDLDLPSGTQWACCNVGANTPEEYGGFYAWGETKVKKTYSRQNYKFYNGSNSDNCYTKNFWTVAGTDLDAAHVNWSNGWQMPTHVQFKELMENCIFEYITINGINGAKFTGPNGQVLFLPAAGLGGYNTIIGQNETGWYSLGQVTSCNVASGSLDYVFFNGSGCEYRYYLGNRTQGYSVRPVKE